MVISGALGTAPVKRGRTALSQSGFSAAHTRQLREDDRNCFSVFAEFWRQTSHKVNDDFSAQISELHVEAIGTFFSCRHRRAPFGIGSGRKQSTTRAGTLVGRLRKATPAARLPAKNYVWILEAFERAIWSKVNRLRENGHCEQPFCRRSIRMARCLRLRL